MNVRLTKLLYRVDEVATLLSFSRPKVYELVRDGKLAAHFHNGIMVKPMRITGQSIQTFIAKHTVDTDDLRK